jgi:hypothetical protein
MLVNPEQLAYELSHNLTEPNTVEIFSYFEVVADEILDAIMKRPIPDIEHSYFIWLFTTKFKERLK